MATSSSEKIIVNHFLKRCEVCGTFRGEVTLAGEERPVRVACRCTEGRCPRCRRPLVTMPFSSSYDELDGKVWHQPHFGASCALCGPLFMAHFSDFHIDGH